MRGKRVKVKHGARTSIETNMYSKEYKRVPAVSRSRYKQDAKDIHVHMPSDNNGDEGSDDDDIRYSVPGFTLTEEETPCQYGVKKRKTW